MTRDELIEAMARAICVSSGDNPNELESGNCFPLPWMDREAYRQGKYDNDPRMAVDGILPNGDKACCIWRLAVWKAQAALAAIEAQGMAIVPVEATDGQMAVSSKEYGEREVSRQRLSEVAEAAIAVGKGPMLWLPTI